jgi:uncharacterized protein YjbI with pentapeptide repeats
MSRTKTTRGRLSSLVRATHSSLLEAGVPTTAGTLLLREHDVEPVLSFDLAHVNMCGAKLVPLEVAGQQRRGATLGGRSSRMVDSDLSSLTARDASIAGSYARTSFARVRLTSCQLEGDWVDCDWTGAALRSTQLRGTFVRCVFRSMVATATAFRDVAFEDCTFEDVDLTRATFERCRFVRTTVAHADITDVSMLGSHFEGGDVGPLIRAHVRFVVRAALLRARLTKGAGVFGIQLVVRGPASREKSQYDLPLENTSAGLVARACLRMIESAIARIAGSGATGDWYIDLMEQCLGQVGPAGADQALTTAIDELRLLAGGAQGHGEREDP